MGVAGGDESDNAVVVEAIGVRMNPLVQTRGNAEDRGP